MIKKIFRQMLVTQILSAMTVMICMLVDSIIIGRFLGVNAMTAYGLTNPILLVFAAIGSMLSAGIQVVCGKSMGNCDKKGTDRCFSAAMFLVFAVSAVGLLVVMPFSANICTLLGAGEPTPDNEVFFLTQDYLKGFMIGAPAFLCAMIMVPFMQMSGNQSRLIYAVAAMTVFDIIFDLINVFAVNGGTFGMGLASSLSYYIALVIGGSYFFKKNCMFRFNIRYVKKKVCLDIIKNGVPTVINQVSFVLLVFLFNNILLKVGSNVAVASYSVISTVGNLCTCFGTGIGSVALMLAAMFYSDEDKKALCTIVKTMAFYAVVLEAALIIILQFAAPYVAALFFTDDAVARELSTIGIRLLALSLLPSALNNSFKSYYQGINRIAFTEVLSVVHSFAFNAIFALILSSFLSTTGVWLAWICGESATLLFISVYVWIKNKKISVSAEAYALIPRTLGAKDSDCLDLTVRTVEESVGASERAEKFCLAHGESKRDSRIIALCIEEMADNIVEHGFTKSRRKDNTIEIRLVFKGDRRMIRIRDNCVSFDPVAFMDMHKTDDPTVHIGIRLVMKMSKDANYVCSLGLNNLTLVL